MNFLGFVEQVGPSYIRGWVFSPDDDAVHLWVVATLDDIDIGSAVADMPRKDLGELGFGGGDHAFEITFDIELQADDLDAIEVFVVGPQGERSRLKRIAASAPPAPDAPAPAAAEPEFDPFAGLDLRPAATPKPAAPPAAAPDIDPFAGLDLRREPAPASPPPGATDTVRQDAARAADIDPFAGLDLRPTPTADAPADPAEAQDADPLAGLDLRPEPVAEAAPPQAVAAAATETPAPPIAGAGEELLAARASDPSSDVDPFADLDLRRDRATPAAVSPPQEASPARPRPDPVARPTVQAPPPVAADPVADGLQVFVLGAARSGTSALFTAINTVLGLPGFGESHVIPAFQRMIHQLRQYVEIFDNNPEDIMIKHMGAGPVEELLFGYVRSFYRDAYAGGGFVDKTPTGEAIYGAPLIESIFPEAFLITTRRTGIEVVQSFRLKFSSDFADACLAWAEAMSGILHARTRCQRLIEIDQFDMANQPERTGRKIATWLGYPEHGQGLGRYFSRERIEKSSTHDWSRRLTLADVDWSPTEKATFTRICGRMMEAFDYPM